MDEFIGDVTEGGGWRLKVGGVVAIWENRGEVGCIYINLRGDLCNFP